MSGPADLGGFELHGRPGQGHGAPAAPRPRGTADTSRPPGAPTLPDWMRQPPPARRTLGRRAGDLLLGVPGMTGLRARWWAWQERRRLHERFPVSFKLVAFFASWALALALVLLAWGLYSMA